MRAVIQKAKKAKVEIDNKIIGQIGPGLVILLGVGEEDAKIKNEKLTHSTSSGPSALSSGSKRLMPSKVEILKIKNFAEKIVNMRIFPGKNSHFDKSLLEIGGEILVVPQFTLYADTSKGRRPYFGQAAKPEVAEPPFEEFVSELKKTGLRVEKGKFGAKMEVELINDGPVTLIIETP